MSTHPQPPSRENQQIRKFGSRIETYLGPETNKSNTRCHLSHRSSNKKFPYLPGRNFPTQELGHTYTKGHTSANLQHSKEIPWKRIIRMLGNNEVYPQQPSRTPMSRARGR